MSQMLQKTDHFLEDFMKDWFFQTSSYFIVTVISSIIYCSVTFAQHNLILRNLCIFHFSVVFWFFLLLFFSISGGIWGIKSNPQSNLCQNSSISSPLVSPHLCPEVYTIFVPFLLTYHYINCIFFFFSLYLPTIQKE